MNYTVNPFIDYEGIIQIPPSKSDSQRAILAASLAKGTSIVRNMGICKDELAMLAVVQKLGAIVQKKEGELHITGINSIPHAIEVNIGESGLAARLLSGVFACSDGMQHIIGEGSVLKRKMGFYFKHKEVLSCQVTSEENFGLPLIFKNKIQTNDIIVNGGESSQDVSGLLYGLCTLHQPIGLRVLHLKSRPYLQMTLNVLSNFGIDITHQNFEYFFIPANEGLQAANYTIEGDWSSASFWLVASALGKNISVEGLQLNSLQADKQLLNILLSANCSEVRSQFLMMDGESRMPLDCDLINSPDLFPALTAYAALTPGTSRLLGVHRLFNKESNRADALIAEFSKLGVDLWLENDTLVIEGKEHIYGGTVNAHNDHRIAMCLAVAGMFATEPLIVENAESVAKSYPQFWEHLEQIKISE